MRPGSMRPFAIYCIIVNGLHLVALGPGRRRLQPRSVPASGRRVEVARTRDRVADQR